MFLSYPSLTPGPPPGRSVQTLVHTFVTSRVDYCNSVLSSAPKKVVDKLQHVQNAAARLVTETRKYERGLSRPMHDDLHWLVIPLRFRSQARSS